jgi:hypothetical protein
MHREGIAALFPHPDVQRSIAADVELVDHLDRIVEGLQREILRTARRKRSMCDRANFV